MADHNDEIAAVEALLADEAVNFEDRMLSVMHRVDHADADASMDGEGDVNM